MQIILLISILFFSILWYLVFKYLKRKIKDEIIMAIIWRMLLETVFQNKLAPITLDVNTYEFQMSFETFIKDCVMRDSALYWLYIGHYGANNEAWHDIVDARRRINVNVEKRSNGAQYLWLSINSMSKDYAKKHFVIKI